MNRTRIALIVVALASATAFAMNQFNTAAFMFGGAFIGPRTLSSTSANRVTRMLGGSAVIDFASGTTTCSDSANVTVTGAQVGDSCSVGTPASPQANSTFSCYVSAADTVKVRHCPAGTAADPASATYYVRLISQQ